MRSAVRICPAAPEIPENFGFQGFFVAKSKQNTRYSREKRVVYGAAGQIRTADLILTKEALYLLSYSSI